jgi:nitroreductase
MTTPNIAKADIIEGFKYRHATKEFDPTKIISNDDMFILETAHLSPSSLVLNHGTLS